MIVLCPGYTGPPQYLSDPVAHGYTEADINRRTPLGRYGTQEEQARAALWLASDDSSFTTGSIFLADGGWVAYGGW